MEKLGDFYTLQSVAQLLGIDYKTLYARVMRGHLKTETFGRQRVVKIEEFKRVQRELQFRKPRHKKRTPRSQFVHDHQSTYYCWRNMLSRCSNPKDRSYHRYGGRGVKVCEEWLLFDNFLKSMGDKPPGLRLLLRDPDQDYSPSNCLWGNPSTTSDKE